MHTENFEENSGLGTDSTTECTSVWLLISRNPQCMRRYESVETLVTRRLHKSLTIPTILHLRDPFATCRYVRDFVLHLSNGVGVTQVSTAHARDDFGICRRPWDNDRTYRKHCLGPFKHRSEYVEPHILRLSSTYALRLRGSW